MQPKSKKRSPVRRAKETKQVRDEAREMRELMSLTARDVIQALSNGDLISWYTGGEFTMRIAKTKNRAKATPEQ